MGRGARRGRDAGLTVRVLCVPAQHAFLADILPRGPGGAEARPGAGVFIAEPTASPPALRPPRPSPSPPPARRWTSGRVPVAERTCLATISAAVPLVRARVLRRGVPHGGFGIFNFGEEGWLGVQAFLQDSQDKREELLIWGRAGAEEGTGLGCVLFCFVFPF